MTATMPRQKPAESRQDYETPSDFLEAVRRRFGPLHVDLACGPSAQLNLWGTSDTRKAPVGIVYPEDDSLSIPWAERFDGRTSWLNPPFRHMAPWMRKVAAESSKLTAGSILVLSPAAVATVWFLEHVHERALVLPLVPRLTFVGESAPYIKDLMLSVYGPTVTPGFEPWRWRGKGAT